MIKPISILVTAYQTQDFIEEALDSIEDQTYFVDNDEYEILLGIDNCTETLEKVQSIREKYRNLRVFMMDARGGPYVTMNTLLDLVKYPHILRFDSDDVMKENMVERILNLGDFECVMFKCRNFSENKGFRIPSDESYSQGTCYFRTRIFDRFGGFQAWEIAADTEFLTRIADYVYIKPLHEILFLRRIHANNLTVREDTGHKSKLREKYRRYIEMSRFLLPRTIKIERVTNSYKEIYGEVYY